MARENQGLQIALIILVILTIGLMVGTFFGWKGYQEEFIRANEAVAAKQEADALAKATQTESNQLKQWMGFQDADTLEVIEEEKNKDMTKYVPTTYDGGKVYRDVIIQLYTDLEKEKKLVTAAQVDTQDLKTRNEQLEKAKAQQIQVQKVRADKAEADRAAERTAHTASRATIQQQNESLKKNVADTRTAADDKLAALQARVDDANRRLSLKDQILRKKNNTLDNILKPTFEVADGKVQWVNQRADTVWINLGHADGLLRQTSFAVYPSDTSDVTDAGSKADIEITKIHEAHLSEARIVYDTIGDPIMPGDLIHTPVWAPGQRQHFALNWNVDIDDDGKDDVELVRNVITMNGGVVDFWLAADGQTNGEMSTNTRYLITGAVPGANVKSEILRSYSDVNTRATELGIRSMPVTELLARMGWKNQSPVIRYGVGGKASDFRPKPPEGVPRTSSGNVSPLYQFKDRRPPRSSGKSAY